MKFLIILIFSAELYAVDLDVDIAMEASLKWGFSDQVLEEFVPPVLAANEAHLTSDCFEEHQMQSCEILFLTYLFQGKDDLALELVQHLCSDFHISNACDIAQLMQEELSDGGR